MCEGLDPSDGNADRMIFINSKSGENEMLTTGVLGLLYAEEK